MAQLAVYKDGKEVIADNLVLEGDYFNMDDSKYTHWIAPYYNPDEGCEDISIELPKGTIRKLIGRELTFEESPVEIK